MLEACTKSNEIWTSDVSKDPPLRDHMGMVPATITNQNKAQTVSKAGQLDRTHMRSMCTSRLTL